MRFSQVVVASGRPEIHLLLTEPRKDRELQRALETKRVMTVHQEVVGTKADYGTVGYEKTAGQILIFPKSLKRFSNRRVVGIDFDLTTNS